MRNYEITFIVDPVLSGDEIKATAQKYVNELQAKGCSIVHIDEMGLRQLAYDINRRHSGYYYCVEFQSEKGDLLAPLELVMSRDEKLLRFLSVKLDKYGVKFNEDKRNGLIGKVKKKKKPEPAEAAAHAHAHPHAHHAHQHQHQHPHQQQPPKPKPPKPVIVQPDNLKRVEGIGPKIAEVLKAAGVNTFVKIASMTPDDLKNVLLAAGDRFSFQDPATWPAQAELAAKGEWEKLKKWQEELKAGKIVAAAAAVGATGAVAASTEEE